MDMDQLIEYMIDNNASDLHIGIEKPPMVRINGELRPVEGESELKKDRAHQLIYEILSDERKARFEEKKELDFLLPFPYRGREIRIRVNLFRQKDSDGAALRRILEQVPNFDQLGLPNAVNEAVKSKSGLVLVTGATGSGKTTSLASMIDHINKNRKEHIVTVEDPIEFLHRSKQSIVHQREIGSDTFSFANALKYVLRQNPNVVMVGEMRDIETIRATLNIAETGHLVFSTLHTSDAVQTINRIVDVFPQKEQEQVRVQLSFVLKAVFSQQLLPHISEKKMVLACEVLINIDAVKSIIRGGKIEQIYTYMQAGRQSGMQTMNQALKELYEKRLIDYQVALAYSPDREGLKKMIGIRY